jgi:hypothetical protein
MEEDTGSEDAQNLKEARDYTRRLAASLPGRIRGADLARKSKLRLVSYALRPNAATPTM